MIDSELLTPQEVADKLRVSYITVIRWIYSGKLPARKAGVQWRVTREDAEGILEQRPTENPETK